VALGACGDQTRLDLGLGAVWKMRSRHELSRLANRFPPSSSATTVGIGRKRSGAGDAVNLISCDTGSLAHLWHGLAPSRSFGMTSIWQRHCQGCTPLRSPQHRLSGALIAPRALRVIAGERVTMSPDVAGNNQRARPGMLAVSSPHCA
jgi:hypothetical protein